MILPRSRGCKQTVISLTIFQTHPMSIQWGFDTSGMYSLPVVILDQKYKYILQKGSVMEAGDASHHYRCLHGCEAELSVGTRSEDTEDGWGSLIKYIFNVTPFSAHQCQDRLNQLENLDSLLTSFNL